MTPYRDRHQAGEYQPKTTATTASGTDEADKPKPKNGRRKKTAAPTKETA